MYKFSFAVKLLTCSEEDKVARCSGEAFRLQKDACRDVLMSIFALKPSLYRDRFSGSPIEREL